MSIFIIILFLLQPNLLEKKRDLKRSKDLLESKKVPFIFFFYLFANCYQFSIIRTDTFAVFIKSAFVCVHIQCISAFKSKHTHRLCLFIMKTAIRGYFRFSIQRASISSFYFVTSSRISSNSFVLLYYRLIFASTCVNNPTNFFGLLQLINLLTAEHSHDTGFTSLSSTSYWIKHCIWHLYMW